MSDQEKSAAVSEPPTVVVAAKPKVQTNTKPRKLPPYNVVLCDDDDHSFEYVIEMMQKLFGHPVHKGFQIAERVHRRGQAVVLTTHKEVAELKRDQIHGFGSDPLIASCQGSMRALIEPAETPGE